MMTFNPENVTPEILAKGFDAYATYVESDPQYIWEDTTGPEARAEKAAGYRATANELRTNPNSKEAQEILQLSRKLLEQISKGEIQPWGLASHLNLEELGVAKRPAMADGII